MAAITIVTRVIVTVGDPGEQGRRHPGDTALYLYILTSFLLCASTFKISPFS